MKNDNKIIHWYIAFFVVAFLFIVVLGMFMLYFVIGQYNERELVENDVILTDNNNQNFECSVKCQDDCSMISFYTNSPSNLLFTDPDNDIRITSRDGVVFESVLNEIGYDPDYYSINLIDQYDCDKLLIELHKTATDGPTGLFIVDDNKKESYPLKNINKLYGGLGFYSVSFSIDKKYIAMIRIDRTKGYVANKLEIYNVLEDEFVESYELEEGYTYNLNYPDIGKGVFGSMADNIEWHDDYRVTVKYINIINPESVIEHTIVIEGVQSNINL